MQDIDIRLPFGVVITSGLSSGEWVILLGLNVGLYVNWDMVGAEIFPRIDCSKDEDKEEMQFFWLNFCLGYTRWHRSL